MSPDSMNGTAGTSQFNEPLRGCPLSSLIWDASLLRNSEDYVAAYNTSTPVSSVDIFLSHAWSDSGWWKQAALLTCCSSAMPYKVMVTSSIVAAWLCWYISYDLYRLLVLLIGIFSFIGSTITLSLFKHRNTTVFLDKCCINQSDFAAKKRGISRLSDYLRVSNKLVVLWTPSYLDRLWCVYELAVFMRTHDKKDVIILNLRHVKLCLWLMVIKLLDIVSFYAFQAYFGRQFHPSGYGSWICIVTSILVGHQAFGCFEDWIIFSSKLNSFSVSDAKCTSPDDYTKLKDLITELYGSEDHFAARVRGLCLNSADEKPAPLWLLSRDSLRICSVAYTVYLLSLVVLLYRYSTFTKERQLQQRKYLP
ncbi:hypothetical protein FOL47_004441 [Perkinsus chesapeaki]|uniref:TIR domain-containing protein n=1 Tax=Perkinsus chesapeaki TaxID=330153 RepID=A0A7J6M2F3_PERCH|nr:hypothetical protein FOL47_004441 [Perkinsus chesapeaki]